MRKLYVNIERIEINGELSDLADLVISMDHALQEIAWKSIELTNNLMKYNQSEAGQRFTDIVNVSETTRDSMNDEAEDLNSMQYELVEYHNKIAIFEMRNDLVKEPNRYIRPTITISPDAGKIKIELPEMREISAYMLEYINDNKGIISEIRQMKDEIAIIWRDPQYDLFAEFVDEVCLNTDETLNLYDDYRMKLDEDIKRIENHD